MDGQQRDGTAVFLILKRKTYPPLPSLYPGALSDDRIEELKAKIAVIEEVEEGGGDGDVKADDVVVVAAKTASVTSSGYPPQGCNSYWRFEPWASNDIQYWNSPPPRVYDDGSYVHLGVIKDIMGTVTGARGRFNGDIQKSLYPHEHATQIRGEVPRLPQCTIVLGYT
jgi:hypothetical protein